MPALQEFWLGGYGVLLALQEFWLVLIHWTGLEDLGGQGDLEARGPSAGPTFGTNLATLGRG